MKSALTVSGTLARPIRCEGCPHRGRAWCLDADGYPACDRDDEEQEDDNEDTAED